MGRDWLDVSSRGELRVSSGYAYQGYLKPYLELITKLRKEGKTRREVAIHILENYGNPSPYANQHQWANTNPVTNIAALIRTIEDRAGVPGAVFRREIDLLYSEARREHAFLLRAEGLAYWEIGRCLDLSTERARQLVFKTGRQLGRAMRHTKVTIIPG